MKKALIVGSTGQDGTYLYRFLNDLNYQVLGMGRNSIKSNFNYSGSVVAIHEKESIFNLIKTFQPDEIYYLAAFHHSSEDKKVANGSLFLKSFDIHVHWLIYFLEAMKNFAKASKLFYAASSHVFGDPEETIQTENTPLNPSCIYGISKTAGVHSCRFYRDYCSLFVSVAILYNHESPLRSSKFVTKKIIERVVKIKYNLEKKLVVGDLSARVDWGFAPDYVEAMQKILQLKKADDFIIASGTNYSIRDFIQTAFGYLNLDYRNYVEENSSLIIKRKKKSLQGNFYKLQLATGWRPKHTFEDIIKIMIDEELMKYAK